MKVRNSIIFLIALWCAAFNAFAQERVVQLQTNATTTGAGAWYAPDVPARTFQSVCVTGTGSGAATVKIQGSLDRSTTVDIATITLDCTTTAAAQGFTTTAPWRWVRSNVTAISGTGNRVTTFMGR